jgi:uncharacterized protein with GYD domain
MPKYLIEASYSVSGVQGLLKDGGSGRRSAVQHAVESCGGSLESLYFAFGSHDVYIVADMPGNVDAAAVSLRAASGGGVASIKTVVLLTPEEVDQAAQRKVDYRPPGG